MSTLWFDLDEFDFEEEDEPLEVEEVKTEKSPFSEDEDIFCLECGELVEDNYQCQICGLVVER